MDTLGLAALATEMMTQRTMQAAQIAVLKTAMDQQASSALQLVQAVSNPPHLGNSVDIRV